MNEDNLAEHLEKKETRIIAKIIEKMFPDLPDNAGDEELMEKNYEKMAKVLEKMPTNHYELINNIENTWKANKIAYYF